MAVDIRDVRYLLALRKLGCCLERVLTLGRLHLAVYPRRLERELKRHGLTLGNSPLPTIDGQPVAEPFFKVIGAKQVDSLDISDYQGATVLHDLNQTVPSSLQERFDLVFDGGTLEHVFNFPAAIKNCMLLAKVGGRVLLHTPANNSCGHGFYQFSPELFYRIFSKNNGFKIERIIIHSIVPFARWYHVEDPAAVRRRVELLSFSPMSMFVEATRIQSCDPLLQPPAQTDQAVSWAEGSAEARTDASGNGPDGRKIQSKWNPRFVSLARSLTILRNGFGFYTRNTLLNRKSFRPLRSIDELR